MYASADVPSGYEFEQFVKEILERAPDLELASDLNARFGDEGFDFAAVRDGRPLLIQVKRTTPQTSYRLEQMGADLRGAAERYWQLHPGSEPGLVVTFPGVLSESKQVLTARSRLEVWDGPHLRGRAQQLGVGVPPYVAFEGPEDAGRLDTE
jgi:hypothetical protein